MVRFLVDASGRIVERYLTGNWRVRPRPEALLYGLMQLQRKIDRMSKADEIQRPPAIELPGSIA